MLATELSELVRCVIGQKCERQNVELKSAAHGTPQKLYDTLSSFSNQAGGGVIIFGIDEKNGYEVTGVYNAQDLQTQVTNQAKQMEPAVRPVFTVAEINGHTVISAEIAECDTFQKPCFYKGAGRLRGSYVRVGEADLPMTEYEIYSYEAFKRKIHDELRVVERADAASFDGISLAEYFTALRRAKPQLARQSEEKILSLQGMTADGHPTAAGIVIFGEYPQAYFPQLSVIAVAIDGTQIGDTGAGGERFIDNRRIEGTLPQMLDGTLAFIRRNTKHATVIADGKRTDKDEYPITAVREIVLNALIHRDYSVYTENTPIRVVIYSDRLEVENPGGLYGSISVSELGNAPTDTRNPYIAGAMEILSKTENRYSGIPTIVAEMKKAGLPPAVFESSRGTFKVTLYNTPAGHEPTDIESRIIAFCAAPRSRREITEFLGAKTPSYVSKKYIRPLVASGKLAMSIPDSPKSKNQKYVATEVAQ